MATTYDRDVPLAGLPPMHVLESGYTPTIDDKLKQEEALLTIKTVFEENLKKNVALQRVSCPLFVTKRSGFNDNLNGVERPATFAPRDFQDIKLEVPFSLAKWKRWANVSRSFSRLRSNVRDKHLFSHCIIQMFPFHSTTTGSNPVTAL